MSDASDELRSRFPQFHVENVKLRQKLDEHIARGEWKAAQDLRVKMGHYVSSHVVIDLQSVRSRR